MYTQIGSSPGRPFLPVLDENRVFGDVSRHWLGFLMQRVLKQRRFFGDES